MVYTEQEQAIAFEALVSELEAKGWHCCSFDDSDMVIKPRGDLVDNDWLVGTKSQSVARTVLELIEKKDRKGLDQLWQKNKIAGCMLDFYQYNFDEEWGEDAARLEEDMGANWATAMRNARTCYSLTTSASRSRLSLDWQFDLWNSLGELTGGLMEDPQSGVTYVLMDGTLTPLNVPADSSSINVSLQSQLERFMEVAEQRGYPIESKGEHRSVATENLDST